MNMLVDIILVLVLIGSVGQGFNELVGYGVLKVGVPSGGMKITEDKFTEYQSSTNPTTVDEFTFTNIILSGLRIIGSALLAVITIIPLVVQTCMACGVDFETSVKLAAMLQGPIWLISIFGWYEWSTGRNL